MFVINIVYTAPLDQVDAVRPAHLDWIKAGHAAGHFVGWGRKASGEGGILLAVGERAIVEPFVQTDPYVLAGVARTEAIEFTPAFLAPGLDTLGK